MLIEDVPGYRVLEQVGEGGFSVVYRAHQEHLDRMVALKVLSIGSVDDTAMRRFQRESRITGRLSGHPNIVTVLDTGTTRSGRPYIAMEYFEQGALTDRLAREGPLPVADVLRIGVKMAGALAATHETDVLHRDVKPQNVLLSRYGEPALADFGIARLVDAFDATHTQAFTPHHAAPEVLEGRPPGVGADIYSLGSTLYQLLAGRPAFKGPIGEGIALLMLRILNEPPPLIPRPDVPPQVADAIGRAMAKTPEQRFATAVEFARALQRVQGELGLPVTDVPHSGASVPPAPRRGGGDTGSASSGPSSASRSGPVPYFPDMAGPPPVPEWAPTAQEPSTPVPLPAPLPRFPEPAPPRTDPHTTPHQPTRDRTDGGSRRGLFVAAGVALVGGVGLGLGALALTGDGSGEDPPASSPSSTPVARQPPAGVPVEPITPEQFAATRPRRLVARPVGRTAALRWALPSAARGLPLLVQRQPAGSTPIVPVKRDSRSATVSGLRPKAVYCFRVGAVLRLNEGQAPDVSWSAPACVNKKRG
ncbi:serine/threonine protein kinase [Actinomadura spongiicola]|uniref:non-specific serine/threonine protein kinase n=1 Tax=Actinomadura spongiicola TaxID=2303421 RepID=A0A372GBH2_9ACTN|nr:serine/threonine-protein kinase [Actinomadura spongiicola]RFS82700.1 serine/threonine protein kinase [Actinomadura spongiicola]